MIIAAHNGKQSFYFMDELDPQKLYHAARNIEIAAWRLSNSRDEAGKGRDTKRLAADLTASEEIILEMLCRRPGTVADIVAGLKLEEEPATDILNNMEKRGSVAVTLHGGKKYYRVPDKKEQKI